MQTFTFDSSLSGGAVDREGGVIRGVSLITGGVTARGHDLTVDDTTIAQLFQSATSKGTIPVKLDHKSGIENVCGYVTAFRVEGNKLLGDWHLLKTHPHFATTMEKAERMPSCFGLSAAFVGKEEAREGKKFARCAELLSVDCVTQPAANPDGLFEAKPPTAVDTRTQIHMSTTPPPKPPPPAPPRARLPRGQVQGNRRPPRGEPGVGPATRCRRILLLRDARRHERRRRPAR